MTNSKSDEVDDEGNASAATGASGGGSFGNQPGALVTGGAPENGERSAAESIPPSGAVQGGDRAGAGDSGDELRQADYD